MRRQIGKGGNGAAAFGKLAARGFAAPQRHAKSHITRMWSGTGQRQIANTGQPKNGVTFCAHNSGKPGNF